MEELHSSPRPTMDQLEAEAGLTWDDALARLKDLEKTLKYEIQTNIREMKLCMSSNKIEDVSIKAARLHDIRRTLASSRALVREECAIMKEFEKIKGILGASRVMDEDDWSTTKNETRYWGDKLAEVRKRQRRLSGDVVDLDSVVSDILTRSDMEDDSLDSLDNLSFHLTNYPLFNNAPYGHHLSVPSRPESAMSDVSAVSTGIAGYFKGRDTTTDMSQSETETSVTPTMQKKKLFTRSSSGGKDSPSLDGSEFEEETQDGVSMQKMYLMQKRQSAMAFKKKALSEKEANVKAIQDHEVGSEEGYSELKVDLPEFPPLESGYRGEEEEEEELRIEEQQSEEEKKRLEDERRLEEERQLEAQMIQEEEEEGKRMLAEENRAKEAEEEKKRAEKEALKKQVEERKKIEAEEKKKMEAEKKKKLEEKKKKDEEKKKKMEEKQKKLEEKKKKEEEKQKKLEEKKKKMAEKQKKDEEKQTNKAEEEGKSNKDASEDIKDEQQLLEIEGKKVLSSDETSSIQQFRNETVQDENQSSAIDNKEAENESSDMEIAKPRRSKSRDRNKESGESKKTVKSRSQSKENKQECATVGSTEEQIQAELENEASEKTAGLMEEKNKTDIKTSSKKNVKKPIKSRSQSKDNKSRGTKLEDGTLKETPDSIEIQTEVEMSSKKDIKKPIKSRSQSKDNKSRQAKLEDGTLEETPDSIEIQTEVEMSSNKDVKKPIKSRSQSKDNKSRQTKLDDGTSVETPDSIEIQTEVEMSSNKDVKKPIKSRSQSKDNKSRQTNLEDGISAETPDSIEIQAESDISSNKDVKTPIKSRSQSRDNKNRQTKTKVASKEMDQEESLIEKVTNESNINKKSLKSRSQSRESGKELAKNDQEEDEKSVKSQSGERKSRKELATPTDSIEAEAEVASKSKNIKKLIQSRSQSRDNKSRQTKTEEIGEETSSKSRSLSREKAKGRESTQLAKENEEEDEKSRSQSKDRKSNLCEEDILIDDKAEIIRPKRKKGGKSKGIEKDSERQLHSGDPTSNVTEELQIDDRSSSKGEQYNKEALKPSNQSESSEAMSESRIKIQSSLMNEDIPDQSYARSPDRSKLQSEAQEYNDEQYNNKIASSPAKSPTKSRSQSKDSNKTGVNESNNVVQNEAITKPKRSKNKQSSKGQESQRVEDNLYQNEMHVESRMPDDYCEEWIDGKEMMQSESFEEEDLKTTMDQCYEGDRSRGLAPKSKSRSCSRDSKKRDSFGGKIEAPEDEKPTQGPPIVKPQRKKGRKQPEVPDETHRSISRERKQREMKELTLNQAEEAENTSNSQFVDSFKGASPEYAEIDYEGNDNISSHKETQGKVRVGSKERKKSGEEELHSDLFAKDEPSQEPIYAQVQKRQSFEIIMKDDLNDQIEPLYAEVNKSFSRNASSERRHDTSEEEVVGLIQKKKTSRQASRERREEGLLEENFLTVKARSASGESRKSEEGLESVLPGIESSMTPDGDFWLSEDQMDVSSTGLPDMTTVRKPQRKSKKKPPMRLETPNDDSESSVAPSKSRVNKGRKGLAADPGLQKYLAQNKSLNLSEANSFEFQDIHAMEQPSYGNEFEEEEGNNYLMDPNDVGYGSEDYQEYLSAQPDLEHFEGHEGMERPLSALGQYSGEDSSPYPDYNDDPYVESGLIREKPDGMDREELCHFDPSHFKQGRTNLSKEIPAESSITDDSYYKNFSQKIDSDSGEPLNNLMGPPIGKSSSRERPSNLDLTDIRPRDKTQLYKDEIHLDDMDLANSLSKKSWKKPGRRRRTVSQSFDSDGDEYDDEEFLSGLKSNYPIPPLLQPPPRKNRSRSGSMSPLPKEKENIGPKLERMFSTGEDNVLEYEYDDNGVKKIKKVSFATENEQFVLRPDPEVRSIPGTKLFTFSPSKTHEQPSDHRGRQWKKTGQNKRSNSADVFPTWTKNSALNFLKSMTSFSGSNGASNAEGGLSSETLNSNFKFEDAFAAAAALSTNESRVQNVADFSNGYEASEKPITPLNDYLDQVINQAISSPQKKTTTQSLDNVNLQNGDNSFYSSLPNRPYSTEPNSVAGSVYSNSDKKQFGIFGNMIQRAKSLSRSNSRQNSEERSIFKNLFQSKSSSSAKVGGSGSKQHKRSISFDGFARKISGGSSSSKAVAGEPSIISTEENYTTDGGETEFSPESETETFMNRLKTKKVSKTPVDKTDFDKLFARGLALSAEKEKQLMELAANSDTIRPTTPFEVFSKDEVFKKSQQGAGISFEEKVKYFLDDLSHQAHTSSFQAPMNCSPVAAAAAVAAMAPPRSTIASGVKGRVSPRTTEEASKAKESPHQFLRRAQEFVKQAEVDSEYSQPVWPAIVQSPEDLPPPKSPKSPLYPPSSLFDNLTPATQKQPSSSENVLRNAAIPFEVSKALAPMMACMMEMKNSSKSPETRPRGTETVLQRSASSSDPFPGSYRTDLGRAEYGTLSRKDSAGFKGRASSVSSRFPLRDNSLDRVQKLRRSSSRDAEINHRRRSQEPLTLDVSRCDSRMSNYSADVPDLEDADISNAMMLKVNKDGNQQAVWGTESDFLSPSPSVLLKKEKVLDQMTRDKLALQEAKSWLQTVILIILCICAIIFIQAERRN